ncbi:hypothetical protein [Desulfovibrio sp. TomC]|uniref:hypothetical protein n=1 Tax=Desulfovibrio sp. TomC TaxID=1562888 RepID=UPI0005BDF464|nr:hypothetical protein [Desulfovibrio sp. TomC]
MKRQDSDIVSLGCKKWVRPIWGLILGGIAGFLLLHPYVMLLASMGAIPGYSSPDLAGDWSLQSVLALEYAMLPMAVPLVLFGTAFGLMTGLYLNHARRLQQLVLEQEKGATALEAVKALTATLSHYLLNANMIIGGQVRHCRRFTPSQEILDSLQVVEEQGRIIDAAIGALRELARIVILRGSSGQDTSSQISMIDLAGELEERLRKLAEGSSSKESVEV